MSNQADLSFQEREAALQTARSILEAEFYGVLELNLQRLCWSPEAVALLARAAAMYCTQGTQVAPSASAPALLLPPSQPLLTPTQAMRPPTPTQAMRPPTPTQPLQLPADERTTPVVRAKGSERLEINLPPGHVIGTMEIETSDGIPLTSNTLLEADDDALTSAVVAIDADNAKTGAIVDHTQPVVVDGQLSIVKRAVGFPLDSAGGHSRSGEM